MQSEPPPRPGAAPCPHLVPRARGCADRRARGGHAGQRAAAVVPPRAPQAASHAPARRWQSGASGQQPPSPLRRRAAQAWRRPASASAEAGRLGSAGRQVRATAVSRKPPLAPGCRSRRRLPSVTPSRCRPRVRTKSRGRSHS
eukprot:scaffold294562_cov23-Tisochrysis_lutea.AAC.1